MKKFFLLTGTALLLAGCNQGGSGDEYNSGSGTDASSTNYNSGTYDSSSQGGSTAPGGEISGSSTNSVIMGGTNATDPVSRDTSTRSDAGTNLGGNAVTP